MRLTAPCRADGVALKSLPVLKSIPVRSTFMNDLDSCPRKALLRHRAELGPKGYRTPLEVGSLYHSIMAALACGYPVEEVRRRSVNLLLDEEARLYAMTTNSTFADGKAYDDVADELQKDYAMALVMALWSWKHDPIDFTKYKPKRVEETLSATVQVDGREMDVIVQPDVLYEDSRGRIRWPDHKTTGRKLQNLVATMEWDAQRLLTAHVIAKVYGPDRVGGSIHFFIQRPTIRLKKDESHDEYMARVDKWYAEPMPDEHRRCLRLIDKECVYEGKEFTAKLKEAAIRSRTLPLLHKWPRRRSACFGMFESLCEYHRLCSTDPLTWHTFLPRFYEKAPRRTDEQSWAWWREPGSENPTHKENTRG